MHSAFCNCVIKGRFPLPCADYVLFGLKMNLRIILDGTRSPAAFIDPGNSHSRGFQPLLAVPDAPPACFLRGTHIVAAYSRSLWFPTLRLPVSATGGGRLRSHWRRQASVPQGAAMASPSQVQCCTQSATARTCKSKRQTYRRG